MKMIQKYRLHTSFLLPFWAFLGCFSENPPFTAVRLLAGRLFLFPSGNAIVKFMGYYDMKAIIKKREGDGKKSRKEKLQNRETGRKSEAERAEKNREACPRFTMKNGGRVDKTRREKGRTKGKA